MEKIYSIETYFFESDRDELYLGPLVPGDTLTTNGYIVRQFSKTIYPCTDRSIIIKVTTHNGVIGWGETYGTVAPKVISEFFQDLIIEFVRDKNACSPEIIHDELYQLMRVRGYWGGFWLDALSALDIALWDIKAKLNNSSIAKIICGNPLPTIDAYISGLPGTKQSERISIAKKWINLGFNKIKIKLESLVTSPKSIDIIDKEFKILRSNLGDEIDISIDMHWIEDVNQSINICKRIEKYKPWFIEAPCLPEDLEGLKKICDETNLPIAVGEEWRTYFDARMRSKIGISIMQPEIGHTGITEFIRICKLANQNNIQIIPHATVAMGIFLTASLQVSSALGIKCHEFQHSVMERNKRYIDGFFMYDNGRYTVPMTEGLGVEPSEEGLKMMTIMSTCK